MISGTSRLAEFEALTAACDRFLLDAAAPAPLLDVPALHVVSSHPAVIRTQLHGPDGAAEQARHLARHLRNVVKPDAWSELEIDRPYDVVLIGGLVSPKHLDSETDFYFGRLQEYLASAGLSSLLLLRNQTGTPSREFRSLVRRDGSRGRRLLPEVLSAQDELGFIRMAWAARSSSRGRLDEVADSRLRRNIAAEMVSPSTTGNLRLEAIVRRICARVSPSAVVTMFEGHAWERCVYRGAAAHDPGIMRVGYQHTILRKHAHGIRRGLGNKLDPDLVLCTGPATCQDLASNSTLEGSAFRVFGTHRMRADPGGEVKPPGDTCLVLPEGLQDEAAALFGMALKVARVSPETRFIFRCHPVLPYSRLLGLPGEGQLPPNVEVSTRPTIEDDFERSSTILYRGSSAVIYGILSGLRPFYLELPDELTLDPIYVLDEWRERICDAGALLEALERDRHQVGPGREAAWRAARDFCAKTSVAERPEGLADLIDRVKRAEDVRN